MENSYRKNAGMVVFNSKGKVLLCARSDQKGYCWQFPQGGIETGEEPLKAAVRELYEETGIKSVELIAQMPRALRYDFPISLKLPFKGQEQYWFLFYFTGDDVEINFSINPLEVEFKDYKWADIDLAPKEIAEFKKDVYNKVVGCFSPLIIKYLKRIQDGL